MHHATLQSVKKAKTQSAEAFAFANRIEYSMGAIACLYFEERGKELRFTQDLFRPKALVFVFVFNFDRAHEQAISKMAKKKPSTSGCQCVWRHTKVTRVTSSVSSSASIASNSGSMESSTLLLFPFCCCLVKSHCLTPPTNGKQLRSQSRLVLNFFTIFEYLDRRR